MATMTGAQKSRKLQYKRQGDFLSTTNHWQKFLDRQSQQRAATIGALREAADSPTSPEKAEGPSRNERLKASRAAAKAVQKLHLTDSDENVPLSQFLTSQFVFPEYLCEIPPDLTLNWSFYMRPAGLRGFLFCNGGRARLYSKHGKFLGDFFSEIPGNEDKGTILDVVMILHTMDARVTSVADVARIHLIDVLCWNGCSMTTTDAECRQWFLNSRYEEFQDQVAHVTTHNQLPVTAAEVKDCTFDNLLAAYYKTYDFQTEAFTFVHKQAFYIPGVNPLYLLWKDSHISKWPIDTPDGNTVSTEQESVLTLVVDQSLLITTDGYILLDASADFIQAAVDIFRNQKSKAKTASKANTKPTPKEFLIRVSFSGIDFELRQLTNPRPIGIPSSYRTLADSLSRVLFQHTMRNAQQFTGLTVTALFDAAKASMGHSSSSGGGGQGQQQQQPMHPAFIFERVVVVEDIDMTTSVVGVDGGSDIAGAVAEGHP